MDLKFVLEAILFSAQKPMSPKELRDLLSATANAENAAEEAKLFKKVKEEDLLQALEQLHNEHVESKRSFRLTCIAGSWQFVSSPEYAPWLMTMVGQKNRPPRLSQPALETLAIIAYRQPITRAEVEQVRGVAVDGVVSTLVERGLIEQCGRAEVVGRPSLYGTTSLFLEYFGLRALNDLPAADELRRIPVQKPEALVTAEAPATAATEPLPEKELKEVDPAAAASPEEPKPADAPTE